jgi:uncharacterized protein (DUF1330 family)
MDKKDININFDDFEKILDYFKSKNYQFVNEKLKQDINNSVNILFPNINQTDSQVLYLFTENIIEKISLYFNFKNNESSYFRQWTQNNYRDIKGVILLLLPFIDDKNNGKLLNEMIDLNQFLYSKIEGNIPDLSLIDRNELLKNEFKFSNMSIGMLQESGSNMLPLYEQDGKMKLIYKIIHHNYLGLLKTLEVMNGKYYVNWTNIVPILFDTETNKNIYKNSELYKKTIDGLTKLKTELKNSNENLIDFFNNYYGLYLGDFYNVIKTKLYYEIKNIKWMIFTIRNNQEKMYNIQLLKRQVKLDSLFNFNNYDDIDSSDKFTFEKDIQKQILLIKSNINISQLWSDILIFLANDYSKKLIVKTEVSIFDKFYYQPTINKYDFSDDGEDDEFSQIISQRINNDDIIEFLSKINPKHIWNFLYESIKKLESTYLRDYLIKNNSISDIYYLTGKYLNFKNIYNIAKSITHYTEGTNWLPNDSHFISFKLDSQKEFFNRFLDNIDFNIWLKLKNNIIKEYGTVDYKTTVNGIYNEWSSIKIDLIFEILIKNGLLTDFQVDLDISDKKSYLTSEQFKPQILKKMEKKVKSNPDWKEAYYYLTNDKYKNLPKLRYQNEKIKRMEDLFYFELFSKDQNWYSFYAMDWLSQIGFFHHYINHRVLFVTGATGQGKSTQVPKLLLFALKAFEMKSDGKVVCTQPRIPPTKGNSSRIADELGVPIVKPLLTGAGVEKTDNFYVQMKYSEDSHTKENCPHLTLKILTDGTLYEELQQNPIMKEQIFNSGKTDFIYGTKNHYDIIILDESHEHNTNMDMILTLARQTCYYNNSVKLIIMSATMDEDEPIYRSYFRCINDNLIYPIKSPSYCHPILKNIIPDKDYCLPETIYMDRRFHISPPGETTQYTVTEYYTENLLVEHLSEKDAADATQEEGYNTVNQICQKYPTGEILFFSTGAAEIKKAVEKLNLILPQGSIALPYYSDLHPNYKDIIEKIDKKIFTIKNRRDKIHLEWGEDYIEDNTVPEGSFQRAVIVATNVAEASITINTLKFVVDIGYSKVNSFNTKTRLTQLNVEKIAEASRIQRKGRVGRVSDGIAYFIYPKGSREKIQPKYKITQEDQSNLYLKLSTDENSSNNELIIPNIYNPNYIFLFNNNFYTETLKKITDKLNFFKRNIYFLLKKQYEIKNKIIKQEDYWNKKYYSQFMLENYGLSRLTNGQFLESLSDINGAFYIIHPKENFMKRNINNQIIYYNDVKVTKIPQFVFFKDIELLSQRLILIDQNYSSNIFNIDYSKKKMVKTDLYNRVLDLQKKINDNTIDVNDCLTLFAAAGLNCFNDVLSIIIFIKTIKSISALAIKETIQSFYSKWYLAESSEIFILYNILNNIKADLKELAIVKIIENNSKLIQKTNELVDTYLFNFKANYKKNIQTIPEKFKNDTQIWNLLRKLYNSGKLENKSGKEEIKLYLLQKIILKDLIDNSLKIKLFCTKNFLKYEAINLFLMNLGNVLLNVLTIERNVDIDLNEISPLKWIDDIKTNFSRILKGSDIKEKIIKSFIIGRPLNYAIKLDFNNDYYNMFDPTLKGYLAPNRFLQDRKANNLLFYYDYADVKGTIVLNLTNNIDLEYFVSCNPQIFNKNIFKKIVPSIYLHTENKEYFKEYKDFIQINGSNYDSIVCYVNNNSLGFSPWENNKLLIISEYFKKLRNN